MRERMQSVDTGGGSYSTSWCRYLSFRTDERSKEGEDLSIVREAKHSMAPVNLLIQSGEEKSDGKMGCWHLSALQLVESQVGWLRDGCDEEGCCRGR